MTSSPLPVHMCSQSSHQMVATLHPTCMGLAKQNHGSQRKEGAGLQNERHRQAQLPAQHQSDPCSLLLRTAAGRRAAASCAPHRGMHQGSRGSRKIIPLAIVLLLLTLHAAPPPWRACWTAGCGSRAAAAAAASGRCARPLGSGASGGGGSLGGGRVCRVWNERELQTRAGEGRRYER
ncbi:hypothetical protein ABPG75_013913 [Micractinium tetrahymenae]